MRIAAALVFSIASSAVNLEATHRVSPESFVSKERLEIAGAMIS